ncbi:MAG: hypothetical protein LC723_06440 [Actinobacteria bacterium]|nr:hypothetical protein [Actinomycetota bacterium]
MLLTLVSGPAEVMPVCHPDDGTKQAVCVTQDGSAIHTDHGKHTYAVPTTITLNTH